MGSLGDHNDDEIQSVKMNSTLEGTGAETQPFDSQFSPRSAPGEAFEDEDFDELQFPHSTLPYDDTVPVEDATFETQVVNLAGETQVLDGLDGVMNMGTQLLDECDDEAFDTDGGGTDGTEVLGDTEELSDDDSVKRAVSHPVDPENELSTTISKQEDKGFKTELDGFVDEERSPGSERRDFTSVRAAALRASGLAARRMAFKGTDNETCFIKTDGQSSKLHTAEDNGITVTRDSSTFGKEVDLENCSGELNEQMKRLRNENKCRVGSSTVRRLFMDDPLAEIEAPNNNSNNADLPQLPACGNEMVGLSYVDSQEPGDLSQANALDFVDRFLKFNVMDFDQEVDVGKKSTAGKSKSVSSAKGTQSLAKRTNPKSTTGERGIFDWDDNREDEGGGDFFTKKKESFFDFGGQRRSFTQPQKFIHLYSNGRGAVDETKDKEDQSDTCEKVKGLINSDSKLVLHKSKRNAKTAKVRETKPKKNLTKELDEQFKIGSSDGMEVTCTDKDMLEMANVGFDTQVAAEAMEALCSGLDLADCFIKDSNQGTKNMCEDSSRGEKRNRGRPKKDFLLKRLSSSSSGVITRNLKQIKCTGTKLSKESTASLQKQAKNVRTQCDTESVNQDLKKAKRPKPNAEGPFPVSCIKNMDKVSCDIIEQTQEEIALRRNDIDELDGCNVVGSSSERMSVKKRHLHEQCTFTPIARRTRQRRVTNQSMNDIAPFDSGEPRHLTKLSALNDKRQGSRRSDAFTMLSSKEKSSKLNSNQSGELEKIKLTEPEKPHQNSSDSVGAVRIGELNYKRGRTPRQLLGQLNGRYNLRGSVHRFDGQETNGQSLGTSKRSKSPSMVLGLKSKTQAFAFAGTLASKLSDGQNDADTISAGEGNGGSVKLDVSPGDRCKPSGPASVTPVSCTIPVCDTSPICMGDEYLMQSCRKNLSRSFLMREVNNLNSSGPEPTFTTKDSRMRRDMANVRVLFSQHLDEDILKQQKKILARLGASVASSISEATHFVTDRFVRTRNMLEAIAFGKPVVTHLWLKSCGQASCFIDERNYILRDAKKEKEFGFSLPVSLARACQRPLLQGLKVLITPNTKPGKELLANLVKAVHGLVVERIGRSTLKDDTMPGGLLVLSCEEDYAVCVPFLEKGATIYSSELLLNGIVTQKLEYERHRLFVDHIKRTRKTIWLKQDSNQYLPVTSHK